MSRTKAHLIYYKRMTSLVFFFQSSIFIWNEILRHAAYLYIILSYAAKWMNEWVVRKKSTNGVRFVDKIFMVKFALFYVYNSFELSWTTPNGWILLNVGTMPKILRYLLKVSTLSSNIRFSASFRRLEESTQC